MMQGHNYVFVFILSIPPNPALPTHYNIQCKHKTRITNNTSIQYVPRRKILLRVLESDKTVLL